jgi:sugar phosphate isomerase/epimerase
MDSLLEDDLRICKETGFEEFEISFAKAMSYLEAHSMEELGKLVKESGLRCVSINAIFSISFCDEKNGNVLSLNLNLRVISEMPLIRTKSLYLQMRERAFRRM